MMHSKTMEEQIAILSRLACKLFTLQEARFHLRQQPNRSAELWRIPQSEGEGNTHNNYRSGLHPVPSRSSQFAGSPTPSEAVLRGSTFLGQSADQKVFGERSGGKEHPGFPGEDSTWDFKSRLTSLAVPAWPSPIRPQPSRKNPQSTGCLGFPAEGPGRRR